MDSEPFWDLIDDKSVAYITCEAFWAFSDQKAQRAIKEYLLRSIREDTVSAQYSSEHPGINWMVAEEVLGIIPFVGLMIAV